MRIIPFVSLIAILFVVSTAHPLEKDLHVYQLDDAHALVHHLLSSPARVYTHAERQLGEAPAQSSMKGLNDAFESAQKMTDVVATSGHENEPVAKTENGDDDTNINEIMNGESTKKKESNLKDALKQWDQLWKMSSKDDTQDEKSFTADAMQAHKAKKKFQNMLIERQQRMSVEAAAAVVKKNTVHDEAVKMLKNKVSAAKASYLAAVSGDMTAEARVRQNEEDDMKRTKKNMEKEEERLETYKKDAKKAVHTAAVAVEIVRQHDLAAHEASSKATPVKITVDDTSLNSVNDASVSKANKIAPPLEPPTSVVRAFKEVAAKNRLQITVKGVAKNSDQTALKAKQAARYVNEAVKSSAAFKAAANSPEKI